jgi:hypothetical protein
MSKDRLIYLPLGGAGEVGMNAYVFGYGPKGKRTADPCGFGRHLWRIWRATPVWI